MAVTNVFQVPEPRLPLTPAEREQFNMAYYQQHGVNLLRDFPGVYDLEIVNAVQFPHEQLRGAYESGCAEPWTSQLVCALLAASNQRVVFEGGGFVGQTSGWLAMTLQRMGGGQLFVAELEPEREAAITARLAALPIPDVEWRVLSGDVLQTIPKFPRQSIGFAWIDDNHEKAHVRQELGLLLSRMRPGGIITGHDVWGSCDLQEVFHEYGGYSLDLPRLGPAGGVGIIQVR